MIHGLVLANLLHCNILWLGYLNSPFLVLALMDLCEEPGGPYYSQCDMCRPYSTWYGLPGLPKANGWLVYAW